MRKLAVLTALLLSLVSSAQIYDPVKWDFRYEKTGEKEFDIVIRAIIEKDSHIYGTDIPEGGPIPTSISFDTLPGVELSGKFVEVLPPEEKMDEAFGFRIKTWSDSAVFRQKVTSDRASFTVSGVVTFMACNNATCLPPRDVEFSVTVKNDSVKEETVQPAAAESSDKGLLGFFFGAFLLGLLGVLTPCVYPMIPMTVAFFTRDAGSRSKAIMNAVIFGFSIMLIYTLPGLIISLTGAGAGFANALSTHWIPNTLFFLLFAIFSASFFGAFEIVLPSSWASSADSRVDRGGALASFFLALTTVIVSFSCTGPIVGSLLVEASRGDVLRPTVGMFAFGLAFALPFTMFALFPAVMSRLPKSGGWLNSVKVVLGFLMLGFSMKFLMTIDSVYNLNILSRDIFLSVWIALSLLLGLYLLGKIKFSHDSDMPYIGTFRLILAIVTFSFMIYLVPGLFGAPLTGLSSLLPDRKSTGLNIPDLISENRVTVAVAQESQGTALSETCSEPKYSNLFELPYGLKGYFEYNQGLQCAKEQNKPVLLDFKGHACANCKLMEARVWSDPEVLRRLRENFVIVALYVDDRTQLPEKEWVTSAADGKVKKSIGKINEDLEISKFGTNALPLYVITDHEGKPLNKPMPTNLNVEEYKKWLDEGLAAFRNR